nr:response regulator [Fischerella sp. PCC 9605]
MKKILMIEDNEDFRLIVCEFLRLNNFQLICAENGLIGLNIAKDQQPDLILSDINMPELNGYEVLEGLRNNIYTATIPFIFITSEEDEAYRCRALQLGANGYLIKPVDINEFLDAITTHLT